MDTSDAIAVLFDDKYRLLHSSPKHRALLRLDASELYGSSFYRIQSQSQAAPTVATPSESITCPDCGLILNITRDATGTTLVYDLRDWKRRCKHSHLGDPAWCLLQQGTPLLVRGPAFSLVPRPCAARRERAGRCCNYAFAAPTPIRYFILPAITHHRPRDGNKTTPYPLAVRKTKKPLLATV
jgi:hypothetical protein